MTNATLTQLRQQLQEPLIKQKHANLRAVAGSTRFKILIMLHDQPTGLTVTEMATVLHSTLSRVSHQMKILRQHKIVGSVPRHREVVYRLRRRARLDWYLQA